MTTEEKLLDEIIEILDLFGYATQNSIDNSGIRWSGNTAPIGSDGNTISSVLIRNKINTLMKNNVKVKKKFKLHFDNVSKITSDITSIKLLDTIAKTAIPSLNNSKASEQLSDTEIHPSTISKEPIIPIDISKLNTIDSTGVTPFTLPTIPVTPDVPDINIQPL